MEGRVDEKTVDGNVEVQTVEGRVEVQTVEGNVEEQTVEGSAEVQMAKGIVEVVKVEVRVEMEASSSRLCGRLSNDATHKNTILTYSDSSQGSVFAATTATAVYCS